MEEKLINFLKWFIILFILFFVFLDLYLSCYSSGDAVIHIKKIERCVSPDSGESKYLIYTEDGIFENSDLLFKGKFNSSDIENKLIGKKVYKIRYIGQCSHIFSKYPNITKVYWCK